MPLSLKMQPIDEGAHDSTAHDAQSRLDEIDVEDVDLEEGFASPSTTRAVTAEVHRMLLMH
jgi:hypothetical protein